MKKSATDIIDQYADNGTLQHGQSQFLGTATKLGDFTYDAETPYGRVVSPGFVKVTGVLNGVTTITADPIVHEGEHYYPARIFVDQREYENENDHGSMKVETTDKVVTIVAVYEDEGPSALNIILFSTKQGAEYPFTQVLANKGVIQNYGGGQFALEYYSDQKPIEISLEDYEGFLGWTTLDQETGQPSSQMLTENQVFVLNNETEQITNESGLLFAMFDKKID